MYKLTDDPSLITRLEDGMTIPEGHRWWDDYQAWLAEGNTPQPAHVDTNYKEMIAARRWEQMNKGTNFNGAFLATDDVAQTRANGAAVSAMLDPNYTANWKGSDGVWVELVGEQIIGVAVAIRTYVQACYDREKVLAGMVDDGTFEPSMLEEGWPT